jgi:cell division protein FtsN
MRFIKEVTTDVSEMVIERSKCSTFKATLVVGALVITSIAGGIMCAKHENIAIEELQQEKLQKIKNTLPNCPEYMERYNNELRRLRPIPPKSNEMSAD